jgi:DNA-binding winged helix-turn-helix (wHTH) protein
MTKKLIIFRYRELFNILEEIKENFEFKLEFYEKERELENLENDNLSDYLVITKKKLSNLKKQIIIDKSPININDLIQTLNINFLKSKFIEQSKIDLGRYYLNLNSRILNQNEKELELTEKESSILIFLKQSKDPVKIDQLQEKVWGYNSELETHTVETHVYRLRKKINDKFYDNEFIISDKKGYFLNEKKKQYG